MCNLTTMVDPWKAFQSYQRTAVVLDTRSTPKEALAHHAPPAGTSSGTCRPQPGVWSEPSTPLLPGRLRVRCDLLIIDYVTGIEQDGLYMDDGPTASCVEGLGEGPIHCIECGVLCARGRRRSPYLHHHLSIRPHRGHIRGSVGTPFLSSIVAGHSAHVV